MSNADRTHELKRRRGLPTVTVGRHLALADAEGSPQAVRRHAFWARRRARHHPLPVQPQGGDDPEGRQVGAEDGQGGEEGRPSGVQWLRALQADAGDVLRRQRQAGRQRREGSRAAVQLHRADRGERRSEEAKSSARRPALGCDHQLPGVRHLGQREVHAVHRRRPPDPGAVQRLARGDAQRGGQAEPDVRQRRRPPLAHPRRGRLARLGRLRASSATPRPGAHWPGSTAIDDPLRCRPGTRLLLPSPEEL